MKNLTPEWIEKAKTVASAEELLEIAKANGVEMSAEDAISAAISYINENK